MTIGANDIARSILYFNAAVGIFGLIANFLSLPYFVRRRAELGNAFLAYLNIADAIVCLSMVIFNYSILIQMSSPTGTNTTYRNFVILTALHVSRCSMTVTGVITIYLNVLRTSVIIWPMVRFRKGLLHASLIVLMAIFVLIEMIMGILFTYPFLRDLSRMFGNADESSPFTHDNPFSNFMFIQFLCLGIPMLLAVMACCFASTAKLLSKNEDLHINEDRSPKKKAAITVLILSVQYVVLKLIIICLYILEFCYGKQRAENKSTSSGFKIDDLLLQLTTSVSLVNSVLNPIVYIKRLKQLREHLIGVAILISQKLRQGIEYLILKCSTS